MKLPYIQVFILANKSLASVQRKGQEINAKFYPPNSLLFYCTECGNVYAKFPVMEVITNRILSWRAMAGCCTRCRKSLEIPGSIWCSWEQEYTRRLPREVLQLELINTINYLLEEQQSCQQSNQHSPE